MIETKTTFERHSSASAKPTNHSLIRPHFSDVHRLRKILPVRNTSLPASESQEVHAVVKAQRSQLIIVSQKRSGSSFVGEIFNQHRDVFYVSEPLKSLTTLFKRDKGSFDTAAHDVLNATLQCDFQRIPVAGWVIERSSVNTCSHVQEDTVSLRLGCKEAKSRYCDQPYLKVSADKCRIRKHLAIKTIRVNDLGQLKSFFTTGKLNVTALHLVRDPRGVMNSRRLLGEANLDFLRRKGIHGDETLDLCQHMERNVAFAQHGPEWLQDNYILVRYEDMAEQPHKITAEIYRHLGWEMSEAITKWLEANTNHNAGGEQETEG
ncbi:carbohydrate sulfotransferase 1-like [Acanthaster planci]|uniref:Carbohydrate sulfotransferase 1-like n=1 Tax=Acanthaster planci TaxID=133434 RepID=A0A8B7ZWJ6_ACAPL|nr:carbohydrate sulfotransferase 1-like [Acanthaster planci]